MKKFLLLLAVATIVLLSSCGEESAAHVDETLPTSVSKLAKNNMFDTIIVIQNEEDMYVYEQGDYKKTISLTHTKPGEYIVAGVIIGVIFLLILGALFSAWD